MSIGCWFRAYTEFWRTLCQACKVFPQNLCRVFKESFYHSTILPDSVEECYGNTSEFHEQGPIVTLLLQGVSSLVRCHPVWNLTIVHRNSVSFWLPFWQKYICREGKSIPRVRVKMLPLLWCKSNVIYRPPGSWLVTLGNCVISRTQCWSPPLADWTHNSGQSQVSRGKWKSVLLSPHITSLSAVMAIRCMNPLGYDKGGRLVVTEWVILST